MVKRKSHFSSVLGLLAGSTVALVANSALALITCVAPINLTATSTKLIDDYVTNGSGCFTLAAGADVDLNGHTITCSLPYPQDPYTYPAGCDPAIAGNGGSSVVKNTGAATAGIIGPFDPAITNVMTVTGIAIKNPITGIGGQRPYQAIQPGANKIQNNTFDSCWSTCIYMPNVLPSTAFIQSNYFSNSPQHPVQQDWFDQQVIVTNGTASGAGLPISNNYIRVLSGRPHVITFWNYVNSTQNARVRLYDNVFDSPVTGYDFPSYDSTLLDLQRNFCEPDLQCDLINRIVPFSALPPFTNP